MGEGMRHDSRVRAAKGGRDAVRRETPQGVHEDVPACEGLEEPSCTAPLDPMGALRRSVEEVDGRVCLLDRQMLIVSQRVDKSRSRLAALERDMLEAFDVWWKAVFALAVALAVVAVLAVAALLRAVA